MPTSKILRIRPVTEDTEPLVNYLEETLSFDAETAAKLVREGGIVFESTDSDAVETHRTEIEERGGTTAVVETEAPSEAALEDVSDIAHEFMVTRPAQTGQPAFELPRRVNDLLGKLTASSSSTEPRVEIARIAADFITSDDYVIQDGDLDTEIFELGTRIEEERPQSFDSLQELVRDHFDSEPAAVLERESFDRDCKRLYDSVAAVFAFPGRPPEEAERLRNGVLLVNLLERIAAGDRSLDSSEAIEAALSQQIYLPESLIPDGTHTVTLPESQEGEADETEIASLRERLREVRAAKSALLQIDATQLQRPGPAMAGQQDATQGREQQGAWSVDRLIGALVTEPDAPIRRSLASAIGESTVDRILSELSAGTTQSESPGTGEPVPFLLTTDAIQKLSSDARAGLSEIETDPRTSPVPELVSELQSMESRIGSQLSTAMIGSLSTDHVRLGNLTIPLGKRDGEIPGLEPWTNISGTDRTGAVQMLGVGDFYAVKNHTERYTLGDLAHIENVMKGETKTRTHRRSRSTEEGYFQERETVEETERDTQTTERFSIERTIEEASRQELQVDSGLKISASYGPTFSVEAEADVSSSTARESSRQAAQSYTRDVLQRSVESVKERLVERTSRQVRTTFEETNEHGFENVAGDTEHVAGLFRFVDKELRSTIFQSPEPRLLLEFLVPEPSAFYRHAMVENAAAEVRLEKPEPPVYVDPEGNRDEQEPLNPSFLLPSNYRHYVQAYGADVPAPPAPFRTVSHNFKREIASDAVGTGPYYDQAKIAIPEGYAAEMAAYAFQDIVASYFWERFQNGKLRLNIGRQTQMLSSTTDPLSGLIDLNNEFRENDPESAWTGDIPATIQAVNTRGWAVSVGVLCRRTSRALESWRLDAYQAIMQAYREKQSAYEEALAAASVGQGIQITGRSPEQNRETERTELKKNSIAMLRNAQFNFDAVREAQESGSFPEIDLGKTGDLSDAIRFFEQAFEWGAMTYLFYPYFWARKSEWKSMVGLEAADPLFLQFLTAGAARVVVPVRPGYQTDVLQFMETGMRPRTEKAPVIGDKQYQPIHEEIREKQGGLPANYTPVGSETFTLPTDLVKLQKSDKLPDFRIPNEEEP